jgi:phage portal protein BeeE
MASAGDVLDGIEQAFPNTVRERQDQYSLRDAYKTVSWIYACVNLIADCISGVEFYFYKGDGELKRDRDVIDLNVGVNAKGKISNEPIIQSFAPPRLGEIHTVQEMIKTQFLFKGLFGESFLIPSAWKYRVPIEWEIVNPLKLKDKKDQKTNRLHHWERQQEGQRPKEDIAVDKLVQWKYANPYNPIRGMAPLTAARLPIEQDFNMATWNAGFFQAGVRNPMALLLKNTFNENQRKEYVSRMRKNFAGFVKGQLPLLVEGGVDVKVLANTIKDLDFVEGKSLTREELCAIYNMPPAQVGIFRYANYANSREQRSILYLNNLKPKMTYYRDVFQSSILNRWFPGIKCDFYWESVDAFRLDPLEESRAFVQLTIAAEKLFNMGYDEEQVALILKKPEFNQSRDVEEEPTEVDEEDDNTVEMPAAAGAPKLARAKKHTNVRVGKEYLRKYAQAVRKDILAPYTGRLDGFLRSYSDTLSTKVAETGMMEAPFWTAQWEQGAGPILSEAFQCGFEAVFTEIRKPLPDSIPDSPEFETQMAKIQRVPAIVSASVSNGLKGTPKKAAGLIKQIPKKICAARMVHKFYNIGRFHAYIMSQTEEHTWCWAGDSMHRDLHGKTVAFGKNFPGTKTKLPGEEKSDSVCTCLTFPARFARTEKVVITKAV